MAESHIQLPRDGLGKKLRSIIADIGSGDIHHELFIPTNQSGQIYTESNPFYVSQVSGANVTAVVTISGQGVFLPDTQIVNISGQTVQLQSGTTVQLPSTQVVNVSGQTVVVASGFNGWVTLTQNGIESSIITAGVDGVDNTVNQLMVGGFHYAYDADANKWNRVRVNKSGQGALVVASSGQDHIVTGKHASSVILFSGYGTTNTIAVSGIGFAIHEQATVYIENLGGGSGINYSVRGHIVSGLLIDALISGTIHSGTIETQTLSDAYEYIDVGIDSTQDNFSGLVTVGLVRK